MMPLEFSFSQLPTHSVHNQWSHHIWGLVYIYLYLGHGWVITVYSTAIHDSLEIAILQFPTSDCSQNEAWCHAKRTDVTTPIENTWAANSMFSSRELTTTALLVCDLKCTPIVMAKHGGPCVHFSGISTCGRTTRKTVSHPQHPPLPTLCKISLPVYVIVANERLQPLTTTWYNSLVLSFSLLKI